MQEDAMDHARAGVAQRGSMPVLTFFILVYRSGEYWYARSVLTGGVAEGATQERAIRNLLTSVDFAIEIADREGFTAEEWYKAQVARVSEDKYLVMYMEAIADADPEREEDAPPAGNYIRHLAVAKSAA